MGALLALIPSKDLFYGAIIIALLAAFGWYTAHERDLGAAHETAALKASSEKLQKQTAAQTADLKARATMAEQAYDKEHAANANLPVIQPVRLCLNANSSSIVPTITGKKPGDAATGTAAASVQPMPSGNTAGPDIGPILSAFAKRADEVSATLREFQSR